MEQGQRPAGEKLGTGIDGLDRELSGGIAAGSLVSIIAGPATQSEHLFQQTLGLRPTLYLSALREPQAIEESLGTVDDVFVEELQQTSRMDKEAVKRLTGSRGYSSPIVSGDETLDAVYELLEKVDRRMNIILDPVNPLEQTDDPDTYREVVNKFKSKVLETSSLGILHCITLEEAPPLRDITLAISDVVVELELVSATNQMQYQLMIPKNRGGKPLLNEIKIVFESEVTIDETRNI